MAGVLRGRLVALASAHELIRPAITAELDRGRADDASPTCSQAILSPHLLRERATRHRGAGARCRRRGRGPAWRWCCMNSRPIRPNMVSLSVRGWYADDPRASGGHQPAPRLDRGRRPANLRPAAASGLRQPPRQHEHRRATGRRDRIPLAGEWPACGDADSDGARDPIAAGAPRWDGAALSSSDQVGPVRRRRGADLRSTCRAGSAPRRGSRRASKSRSGRNATDRSRHRRRRPEPR